MSTRQERDDAMRIIPDKQKKGDDSARFQLVGGPFHGLTMRMFAPWDDIVFQDERLGEVRYELHPPVGKTGEWVYIHNGGTNV